MTFTESEFNRSGTNLRALGRQLLCEAVRGLLDQAEVPPPNGYKLACALLADGSKTLERVEQIVGLEPAYKDRNILLADVKLVIKRERARRRNVARVAEVKLSKERYNNLEPFEQEIFDNLDSYVTEELRDGKWVRVKGKAV